MPKIYKLKPFVTDPEFDKLDREKREKIETSIGKRFTEYEWLQYKRLVMPKSKNAK